MPGPKRPLVYSVRSICLILWLALLPALLPAQAQDVPLRTQSYPEVGFVMAVPAAWPESDLVITTRADFFGKFGWNYRGDDADAVWSAFGSFHETAIDSTLLPADSAYTTHFLTLFVERAPTWYRQWLCKLGRRSIWESIEVPEVGATVVSERRLPAPSASMEERGTYGLAFEKVRPGTQVPTVGRVYAFVHREMCYTVKIESTAAQAREYDRLHERMFNALRLLD